MKKYDKYLFFDIESCNGQPYEPSICSFGYCLTDLNFNLLEKGDILINPPCHFVKKLLDEFFTYKKSEFRSAPSFEQTYEKLKNLFTQNVLAIGFEMKNDIKYLDSACKHFKLPQFNFDFFDIKYIEAVSSKNLLLNKSLKKYMNDLEINYDNFKFHRSVDDAEMTMLVCKKLLKKYDLNLEEFLIKNNIKLGSYKKNNIREIQVYDSYVLNSNYIISSKLKNKVVLNYINQINNKINIENLANREAVYFPYKMISKNMSICLKAIQYIYSNNQYIIESINSVLKIYDYKNKLNKSLNTATKSTLRKGNKFINVDTIEDILNEEIITNEYEKIFEDEVNKNFEDFILS